MNQYPKISTVAMEAIVNGRKIRLGSLSVTIADASDGVVTLSVEVRNRRKQIVSRIEAQNLRAFDTLHVAALSGFVNVQIHGGE